jgi:hypothetical protein
MKKLPLILIAAALIAAIYFYLPTDQPESTAPTAQPSTVTKKDLTERPQITEDTWAAKESESTLDESTPDNTAQSEELNLLAELPPPMPSPYSIQAPEYEAWAEERIDTLDDLTGATDRESMLLLLGEINNPDGNIRSVAMETLQHTRNRDAIPYLNELSKTTSDPAVASHIAETIEFLELETMTERIARKRLEKAAIGQEN